MPDFPPEVVPLLVAGAAAGALLSLAGLARAAVRGWRRLMRRWRDHRDVAAMRDRLRQLLSDWEGVPPRPGVPGRPGVLERLERQDQRMASLERHVGNGADKPMRELLQQLVDEQIPGGADE